MSEPTTPQLRARWEAACRKWSRDNSKTIEATIAVGEDLYFAAVFLIERLEEEAASTSVTAAAA